ncbi:MAG: MBL fold metallo-hydrolase, partial [Proteobacteria bacterium]|nr:MBL fold metallo-hydrolase [Pseudomonadota bacterium]
MTDKNKESDGQKGPGVSVLFQETKVRTVHPGIHILGGMGNSLAIETERGFVQIDTGMNGGMAAGFLESLRTISDAPVHTIVYSHGHNGYNNGTRRFLEDALQQGNPAPQIVAHERLPNRYRRFEETWQLQNHLAAMQFRMSAEGMRKPKYVYPTVTFGDMLRLNMGDRMVEILWAPSETDDAVAVWLPEEKVLYGGPSVIASCINVGTPLRTQRDAVRWADTLDRLSALRPEVLIPSFGKTLKGTDEIQNMLGNMADGLRYLRREVLERLNRGLSDVEIVHDMDYPSEYFEQPWSAPIYGCPDMIVRDIYRSENGWWDRNPTNLHPAPPDRAAT